MPATDPFDLALRESRDTLARDSGRHLAKAKAKTSTGPAGLRAWLQHSYYRGGAQALHAVLEQYRTTSEVAHHRALLDRAFWALRPSMIESDQLLRADIAVALADPPEGDDG